MHTGDRRPDLLMSAHGRRRAAARGFGSTVLANLTDIADRKVPVGGECVALSASARAIASARQDGLAPDEIERPRVRVLVLDPEGGPCHCASDAPPLRAALQAEWPGRRAEHAAPPRRV